MPAVVYLTGKLKVSRNGLHDRLYGSIILPSNVIEFYPDPTLVVDNSGTVVAWNDAMVKMTGVKADSMLGKGNYEYSIPFYGERKPLLLDMVGVPPDKVNGRYTGVTIRDGKLEAMTIKARLKGKDVVLWGRAGMLYSLEGKVIGAIESIRDVTHQTTMEAVLRQQNEKLAQWNEQLELQQAELSKIYDRLKESEEKYRLIANSTNDGIVTLDVNGIITYVNPGGLEIIDRNADRVIGHHFIDFVVEDQRRMAMEVFRRGMSGEYIAAFEIDGVDVKGERITVELNGGSLCDASGKRQGAIVSFRNVSERKKASEELKKARDELERRVNERTAELKEAKEQAELYLDLMGHDINNINQIAMGYLEVAMCKADSNAETAALIGRSLAMLTDSSRLIDNVRKIQQAVGRDLRLHAMDVDIILKEVLVEYSMVSGREVNIRYIPVKGHMVAANQLLKDVFSNIVANAIKHSTGPLDVNIRVSSMMENKKHYFEIIVEDNGPGISDDLKEAVFSRMKRGATKAKGYGLGLYLVKTLVEGFRGRVRVEDRVAGDSSKGCRFVVTLPAAE